MPVFNRCLCSFTVLFHLLLTSTEIMDILVPSVAFSALNGALFALFAGEASAGDHVFASEAFFRHLFWPWSHGEVV